MESIILLFHFLLIIFGINYLIDYFFLAFCLRWRINYDIVKNLLYLLLVYVLFLLPFVVKSLIFIDRPFPTEYALPLFEGSGRLLFFLFFLALIPFISAFYKYFVDTRKKILYKPWFLGGVIIFVFFMYFLLFKDSFVCDWKDEYYNIGGSHFFFLHEENQEYKEYSEAMLYLTRSKEFQFVGWVSDYTINEGRWDYDFDNGQLKLIFEKIDEKFLNYLDNYYEDNDWNSEDKELILTLQFKNCSYESAYFKFGLVKFTYSDMESEYSKNDYYDPF